MKVLGIIPARYASVRFPGKPLADIGGKSMIQRVFEQTSKAKQLSKIIVATDHQEIFDHVVNFGGNVLLTAEYHQSGTDRCCEIVDLSEENFDFVINIQGDEPFIDPGQIDDLVSFLTPDTDIATQAKVIKTPEELQSPNTAKIVLSAQNEALYFSRQPIPFLRDFPFDQWLENHVFYKHIGIYVYRTDVLRHIAKLPVSTLEKVEKLEQLRWLENGYRICVNITEYENMGIDTPEDLEKMKSLLYRIKG